MIRSGCRWVKELKSRSKDFVTVVAIEVVCSPDRYRGRFYPGRRKIRNVITYTKMETKFSEINHENVQQFVSSCIEPKIHFSPRWEHLFKFNINVCTTQSFCTVNIIWQINYISSNECHSFICLLLQTTWMLLYSSVLLGN